MRRFAWALVLAGLAIAWCLGFASGRAYAARPAPEPPLVFRNSQQIDTIVEWQSLDYYASFDPELDGNQNPPCSSLGAYIPSPAGIVPAVNALCAQGYVWDVDDHARWMGSGDLEAGEPITIEQPIVLDGADHLILALSSTRNTVLLVEIPALGWSATVARGVVGCWITPALDYRVLPELPGSNGGRGIVTTVRWTLTATRRQRDAFLDARILNPVAGNVAVCPQPVLRIGP